MMNPKTQLRHRSGNGKGPPTFSAWVMSIIFAAIAVTSFAVDQAVIPSPAVPEGQIEFQPIRIGESLAGLSPVRLIESLIDAASERSDHTE